MAGSVYARKCRSRFWSKWKRIGKGSRGRKGSRDNG